MADLKGATVGVQAATTDYDAAIAMQQAGKIGTVRVYPFSRIGDAIVDLAAGHVDAVMKVFPVAAWFVRETPGLRILGQIPDDPQPLGIGFSRSDTRLVGVVNGALDGMQRNGSYEALAAPKQASSMSTGCAYQLLMTVGSRGTSSTARATNVRRWKAW